MIMRYEWFISQRAQSAIPKRIKFENPQKKSTYESVCQLSSWFARSSKKKFPSWIANSKMKPDTVDAFLACTYFIPLEKPPKHTLL